MVAQKTACILQCPARCIDLQWPCTGIHTCTCTCTCTCTHLKVNIPSLAPIESLLFLIASH